MDRPWLALILMPLWSMLFQNVGSFLDMMAKDLISPAYPGGVCCILMGFLALWIHKLIFRPEFKGSLNGKNLGKGILFLLPAFAFVIMNLMGLNNSTGHTLASVIAAILAGSVPGVVEEVAFRGLSGSNFMRLWHDGKKIRLAAILTGIVFGGVHIANLIAGAALSATLVQVAYAIGLGIMFAAVYFRTGSLWPSIIMHCLIDISYHLQATSGILSKAASTRTIILLGTFAVLFTAYGLFLLRDKKVDEINAVWKDIWGQEYVE